MKALTLCAGTKKVSELPVFTEITGANKHTIPNKRMPAPNHTNAGASRHQPTVHKGTGAPARKEALNWFLLRAYSAGGMPFGNSSRHSPSSSPTFPDRQESDNDVMQPVGRRTGEHETSRGTQQGNTLALARMRQQVSQVCDSLAKHDVHELMA